MAAGEFGLIPSLNITPIKSTVDEKPVLELTDEDIALADDLFRFAVVIKFWGVLLQLEAVRADVSKNWGLMGWFIMGLRDQKTLLVRFELESDLLMALSHDSLMNKDLAFKVFRWKNISNGAYDARILPAWIALPWLPERYLFPQFLSAIENSIGRFIRVDLPTASLARPSVACIFVEVDLAAELPSEIGIKYNGTLWQKIVYQNMPSYCINCGMKGHSTRAYNRGMPRPQHPSKNPPTTSNQKAAPNTHSTTPKQST